jgi:hypothetical protein
VSEKSVRFVLAVVGFVATFGIARVTERFEAWDAGLYWSLGVPVMALAAGIAGYLCPPRTWSYGFSVIAGSVATMIGLTGLGNLWPIGLVFATALAFGCGLAAKLGNWLSRRTGAR